MSQSARISRRAVTLRLLATLAVLTINGWSALFAQATPEAQYHAAKDSAIRSLATRAKQEPVAVYISAMQSALKDLERRLQLIIGPLLAKGLQGSGHINADNLFPGEDGSDKLDGLVYETADHQANVVVTTRSLLATWLADVGHELPHDPIAALATPDFYTFAIESDAAIYKYATIPMANDSRLGVVAAMLVLAAQDTGPFTPDRVIASVVRGSRVFIITGSSVVNIAPPPTCLAVRDSVLALTPRSGDGNADIAYRGCYGERVPRDPAFKKVVAQLQDLVATLPPQ